MVYMNPLETEEDINEYKEWLSTKPYHFLKCLMVTFNMHFEFESNTYANLPLRIELLNKEIQKKRRN